MSGHGGNIWQAAATLACSPADLLDFSANINPLGPPSFLTSLLLEYIPELAHYPDPDCLAVRRALAHFYSLPVEEIIVGNGTSELLFALPGLLDVRQALIPVPAYIDYHTACDRAGLQIREHILDPARNFQPDLTSLDREIRPGDLVLLGQPNNPTGALIPIDPLLELIHSHPRAWFVIDEAFAPFVPEYISLAGKAENLIVLCSLTKIFAIAGLRLGFAWAPNEITVRLKKILAPWSVNSLAQVVGARCFANQSGPDAFSLSEYLRASHDLVAKEREFLIRELGEFAWCTVFPGQANFLFVRLDHPHLDGPALARLLEQQARIMIRPCANYRGLSGDARQYIRIAVRTRRENERLVQAMTRLAAKKKSTGRAVPAAKAKKTPALMLLGTGSDVGKSVLAAGLCRILLQDGLRVAPFKAQNMSLNSFVTRDGGEMGRAQVVQAQACRLDPDVRMNPVLLKPNSDVGSQVIVLGRPRGNMRVGEYVAYKEIIWQEVCQAYASLADEHEVMILEGAGSPGEVNLKAHDIVNNKMARQAGARAILVGDIDRGGVYASFIGHVNVMENWERDLLAGFLVNRFRGDASLLADAHTYVRGRTGMPVLGVVPYLKDLGLPQEDSVGFKAGLFSSERPECEHVEVVLIDLPHISNFTDVEPLLIEKDVYLRIVQKPSHLGQPDAIILPGSKNVPADLAFLHDSGLARAICQAAQTGVELVGICGGFQMLGRSVHDPHGLEAGPDAACAGLGLLDLRTELARDKTLTKRQGRHLASGCSVHGYEIHHGLSQGGGLPVVEFSDGGSCGARAGENIWGCYLHGILDSDPFRRWWINRLRRKRGLEALNTGASYDLEPALDRLADHLRASIDLDRIYTLLGL